MQSSDRRNRLPIVAILLALVAAVVVVYWNTRHSEFIDYDDNLYVTENPVVLQGLSWGNAKWAFTTLEASNWHPLTWLSHMLDVQLYGRDRAGCHHFTSVILHACNTMLVFSLLASLTGAVWRSALVAGLFAIHPLHVESVAWIAERKDVLSTFFGLLAMCVYVKYARQPSWTRYVLVFALFALSLLAKPMLVTLPFVLLLLDYWPLRRIDGSSGATTLKVVVEKLPLLLLSVASSVITVIAQKSGGSVFSLEALPFGQRLINAVVSYSAYIVQMLWPTNLAVLYPHPVEYPVWQIIGSIVMLIAITILVAALGRRQRHLVVGWLWYLGTLVPVIGLLQVGMQARADRYTYVPLIGLFIMIAWSLPDLRVRNQKLANCIVSAAALMVIAMGIQTAFQVGYWHDSFRLFDHTIAVTHRNFVAHNNRGYAFSRAKRYAQAIADYEAALNINERWSMAHDNLGNALSAVGRLDQAEAHYRRAIELAPSIAATHNNLAVLLSKENRTEEAVSEARTALSLRPKSVGVMVNLGTILAKQRRYDEAVVVLNDALKRDPTLADGHASLATVLWNQRHVDEAIAEYELALRLQPDVADVHANYGLALASAGRLADAIKQFERALELDPNNANAQEYLRTARTMQSQNTGTATRPN